MRVKLSYLSMLLLLTGAIVLSCRKETSCENCRTNKPPVAIAGKDTMIVLPADSILLDGSASYDPDGTISSYTWSALSGTSSIRLNNPQNAKAVLKNLTPGIFLFELTVTDDKNASAKDSIAVTIVAATSINHPPIANAGADKVITLPVNSVTLNGNGSADVDNNITSYVWSKISGPPSFSIANSNSVQTVVSTLTEGIYQFELKVTDAGALSSKDTVRITVNAAPISCGSNRPSIDITKSFIGSLSKPRALMAVASAGNKIVFAGGVTDASIPSEKFGSSRVDIYDISTNTWSTAELSSARYGIAAIAAGNKIFFAGGTSGEIGDVFETFYSTIDIYDVTTNSWSVAQLSERMTDVAAAAVGNKVFFAGGIGLKTIGNTTYFGQLSDKIDIYDLSTNTWSSSTLSEARSAISAVTLGSKIYFAGGGISYANSVYLSDNIDVYDLSTNSWSTSTLSEPKAVWKGGIAINNNIYWSGGVTTQGTICDVEIRDALTQTTSFDHLSQQATVQAILSGNKIVYYREYPFGWDLYDINTKNWSVGVLPLFRSEASFISANNTIYMGGGFTDNNNTMCSAEVWKLDF